jgi:hypothetical protein
MMRISGIASAVVTAIVVGTASMPTASAAPGMTGTGRIVNETMPALTEDVRWRGRRVVVVHRYRPHRYYRPFRPVYYRPYYRPAYYGPRCFWRPARTVWTPYGWRWRPAARICRW